MTKYLPGLLLTSTIAIISTQLQQLGIIKRMHLSSLILAILLGVLINNIVQLPPAVRPGIQFSMKKILRLAILGLGFRLSLAQVTEVGGKGLILVIVVTFATLIFAKWIGEKLGLSSNQSVLLAAGTAICGASAIAAASSVLPEDDEIEDDITVAIGTITLFGTLAMVLYPVTQQILQLPTLVYAAWTGSSVHEIAQVVAAGFAVGQEGGQYAILIKLTRVLLIIPVTIALGIRQLKKERSSGERKAITIPWFVFGFLAVVLFNSANILAANLVAGLVAIDGFLLSVAMAGMGLETNFAKMRQVGAKPVYAGLWTTLFISLLGLILSGLLFS